jgi:hypothetical protein
MNAIVRRTLFLFRSAPTQTSLFAWKEERRRSGSEDTEL